MRRLVIYISLLLIITSFTPPKNIPKPITESKIQKTIALIQHRNLYFIRVKLNNSKANMLVDTGSVTSLLDINQANDYNFKFFLTQADFIGLGGRANRYRIANYKFDHDTTSLKIYPCGADMKEVSKSFSEAGMPIVGILGSDFFKNHDAIIDYKNLTLVIHN